MKVIVHTDGGARGNPGPAAVGIVIERTQNPELNDQTKMEKITEFGKRIGEATNNVAEYTAVVEALEYIRTQNPELNDQQRKKTEIQFFLDSNLVVNQLNGLFKIKNAQLRALLMRVRQLEQEVGGVVRYANIPREQNQRADFLVNKALDQ